MENKATLVLHAFGLVVLDISTSPWKMEPVECTKTPVVGIYFFPFPVVAS